MSDTETSTRGLLIGLAVGLPLMGVGVVRAFDRAQEIPSFLWFFVGGDLVHDFVVAPIAALVAVVVLRRVPGLVHGPLRAALFTSAIVVALAWLPLGGYGRHPENPSITPLNYATALATVLAVVWGICLVWFVVALARNRRGQARNG